MIGTIQTSSTAPLFVPRYLLLIHVQDEITRPHAHLVAGRVGLGEHHNAFEFFSVVLVDNDLVAGIEHWKNI
jgi:hypothetical protein